MTKRLYRAMSEAANDAVPALVGTCLRACCHRSNSGYEFGFYTRQKRWKRAGWNRIFESCSEIDLASGLDSKASLRYTQDLPSRHRFPQEEAGAHFHAQAHISAQSPQARQDSRLSGPHEDQERSRRAQPPPRTGPQARCCQRWLPRLTNGLALLRVQAEPAESPGLPPSAFRQLPWRQRFRSGHGVIAR